MARYKTIDTSPRFLAVDLKAQLLLGTFEHALNHLLDREIDLSGFDARFRTRLALPCKPPNPHPAMLCSRPLKLLQMPNSLTRTVESSEALSITTT